MPNAKNYVPLDNNHKFLIVGDYGTGKSTFAATCPEPGFLFNFDNRAVTYKGKDFDYETFPITSKGWVDFEKKSIEVRKDVANGKYKTVILDSTTSMTDLAMERALMLDPKRTTTNGPIWNIHFMMVRNLIEGRIRQFINLDCNLVVCSHLNIVQDQETGAVIDIVPLLTGQLSVKIPGYFDEVYIATTKRKKDRTEYLLQTVPIGLRKARSALSGKERLLPDFIPNDYNEVIRHLKKK